MRFTFFTLGGKQLWEDLFFYQGWRIQKSCKGGRYRLLDEWDIRRESGSLQRCQNAFIHYIEVYQLLKPKQKAVVMLHGFAQSKDSFSEMAKSFEKEGFTAIAVNYPSLKKKFSALVDQFNFLLKNIKDIKEVNFIAYGFGGLVLRKLLSKSWEWKNRFKIGKIVAVDVPNRGSRIATRFLRSPLGSQIFGPALYAYDADNIEQIPDFPKDIDIGVLTTWNPVRRFLGHFIPNSLKQMFPPAKDSHINNAKEIFAVKYFCFNPCKSAKVITHCINFIKYGKFKSFQKIKKL